MTFLRVGSMRGLLLVNTLLFIHSCIAGFGQKTRQHYGLQEDIVGSFSAKLVSLSVADKCASTCKWCSQGWNDLLCTGTIFKHDVFNGHRLWIFLYWITGVRLEATQLLIHRQKFGLNNKFVLFFWVFNEYLLKVFAFMQKFIPCVYKLYIQ